MAYVILQPSSNSDAYKHYIDTVLNKVEISSLKQFISNDLFDELLEIYPSGKAAVWGVTPGKNNITKWNRISRGDIVLFCRKNKAFHYGVVTLKVHNNSLAKQLWGTTSDGDTWEYIYFIDETSHIDIPYKTINKAAEYKPSNVVQGFTVLDSKKSSMVMAALELYSVTNAPTVEHKDYVAAIKRLESDKLDTERFTLARTEQSYLRQLLFKGAKFGTCCICQNEFPVEFLVAAHIKKRSLCSGEEKCDAQHVVAPMCKFGCDELFERGHIGVIEGKICSLKDTPATQATETYTQAIVGKPCPAWNENSKKYFEWHSNYHRDR